MKNFGFTLAEILITLGVIGVIAALTIPTLVNNYKIKQYEIGFKKAYSLLSEAVKRINADDFIISENVTCGACTPNYSYIPDCECFPMILYAKFNGAKNLKARDPIASNYKTFTNTKFFVNNMDDGFFELPNGMSVFFEIHETTHNPIVIIDTNGYKKSPNRYGFDTFAFAIGKYDKVLTVGDPTFYGRYPISSYCNSKGTISTNGYSCGYKALTDPDYWKNLPN